jgi:hypothetical protein
MPDRSFGRFRGEFDLGCQISPGKKVLFAKPMEQGIRNLPTEGHPKIGGRHEGEGTSSEWRCSRTLTVKPNYTTMVFPLVWVMLQLLIVVIVALVVIEAIQIT